MISAVILAAGQSRRMGQPKLLLPWGNVTVLEHVVAVFANAGIEDILVITGGAHDQIQEIILKCHGNYPVRSAFNHEYESGDMLSSLQRGLRVVASGKVVRAAMVGLGDQPQIQESSVRTVRDAFLQTERPLVVPSYQMRRGHPWLVARPLWMEILAMSAVLTPRNFLNAHAQDIHYVELMSSSILADLDTPEDYRTARPQ
jgi:molybdenum cofactor cytidylyltransferase